MGIRADHPDAPSHDEIHAALGRILDSQVFRSCPRLASFLKFVVESEVAGQGSRLKGYTIGVEALGRPDDFDPQADAIVRVEAGRLRAALKRYYSGAGVRDPIVIEMPRGRYVPHFRWTRHSAPRLIWRRARRALQRLLAA